MGDSIGMTFWALLIASALVLTAAYMHPPAEGRTLSPNEMPGVYEVASKDRLEVSVADMHRYDKGDGWILALGIVMKNTGSEEIVIDPASFEVLDESGEAHPSLDDREFLKNTLLACSIPPQETVVGGLTFLMEEDNLPAVLLFRGVEIRLDKEVEPPGDLHLPGDPVMAGNSTVGISGISSSTDGRELRVDYVMKYSGYAPASLEDRACGKFGVLIDMRGMSYPARDYMILSPTIMPESIVEGYMTFAFPEETDPGYLLFWPPDDDGVIFDIRAVGQG